MTFQSPRPVGSGKPYVVRQVRGRVPHDLSDFVGQTFFVLDVDGEDYLVCGPGVEVDGQVRVFEKDEEGYGKDIRVWTVRPPVDSTSFTAEHAASPVGLLPPLDER